MCCQRRRWRPAVLGEVEQVSSPGESAQEALERAERERRVRAEVLAHHAVKRLRTRVAEAPEEER